MKNQKKKRNIPFILSAILFTSATIALVLYLFSIHTDENKFVSIRKLKDSQEKQTETNAEEKEKELGYYIIDGTIVQEGLKDVFIENHDTVGWIKKSDTAIDYPVMYTPDDEQFYIHRGFDKEYSFGGCIFVGAGANMELPSNNIVLYGHHMISETMFKPLDKYRDEEYYKKNKYIEFDTLRQTGTYEVIAVFTTQIYPDDYEGFQYYKYGRYLGEEDFNEYVDTIKKSSLYDIPATAEYGDQLITLSTCAYHTANGRFVVVAKRIKGQEVDLDKDPIDTINTGD